MSAARQEAALGLAPLEPAALVLAREQAGRAVADPRVREFARVLARFIGPDSEAELAEYERCALLGVCACFAEREISPYLDQHTEIVPPLLEEIRAVYRRVKGGSSHYDSDEFRARAFHYGVHKASYLDWRLYLSKDLY